MIGTSTDRLIAATLEGSGFQHSASMTDGSAGTDEPTDLQARGMVDTLLKELDPEAVKAISRHFGLDGSEPLSDDLVDQALSQLRRSAQLIGSIDGSNGATSAAN